MNFKTIFRLTILKIAIYFKSLQYAAKNSVLFKMKFDTIILICRFPKFQRFCDIYGRFCFYEVRIKSTKRQTLWSRRCSFKAVILVLCWVDSNLWSSRAPDFCPYQVVSTDQIDTGSLSWTHSHGRKSGGRPDQMLLSTQQRTIFKFLPTILYEIHTISSISYLTYSLQIYFFSFKQILINRKWVNL